MGRFVDWMMAKESSPFTRTRRAAALSLGPTIPDAAINSRSTATPFERKKIVKRNKKRKKKFSESAPTNYEPDKLFAVTDDIKDELKKLIDALSRKEIKDIREKPVPDKDDFEDENKFDSEDDFEDDDLDDDKEFSDKDKFDSEEDFEDNKDKFGDKELKYREQLPVNNKNKLPFAGLDVHPSL
jgi:hypothetical protein